MADKGAQTSLRIPSELHARLTAAAGDRPLGEEIRRRLEASFNPAPAAAGMDQKTERLVRDIAEAARQVASLYEPWHEDAFAFALMQAAISAIVSAQAPEGEPVYRPQKHHLLDLMYAENDPPEKIGRMIGAMVLARAKGEPK